MPFKHKLSKRLALMRDAAFGLAAAVIACSPDQSISGPPSLLLNSSQPVCQQSAAVWLNNALAAQTGSFTAQFDATPNGAAIAGVVGLSAGAAGAYTDLAPIVAFTLAGQINARNGGAYAAVNVIPYTAGTSYHFRLVVDLPSRTYSAYVTPFGGTEVTIGSGYAFRTEQSAVTALANWAAYTSTGTLTLCNFSLGWQSAAVWLNNGFAAQTGSFTVQFDATPNGAAIVGVVGLSAGAAGAYTDLAPIVAFNLAGQINARDGGAYAAVNVIPYTAGTSYHFRLVVDLPSRTYSAYVTPFGGTEVTIGSGYAFRTEQSAVTALANWASYTSSGTLTLCNVSLGSETPSVSVASVTLLPASVGVGQTVQLTAALTDAAGSPLSGRVVTWASGAPAVATVSGSGLVAGVAAGPGTITATSEGQSGAAAITVTAPVSTNPSTVADLAVAGPTDSSVTLSFTEVDDGTGLPASYDVRYAVAPISWGGAVRATRGSCATPLTGTTTGTKRTCTVLGLQPGITYDFQLVAFRSTLSLNAVFGGLSNIARATTSTSTAPVALVTVSPASGSELVGQTLQLTATPLDANGLPLSGRLITWVSSAPAVAAVSTGGLVTGVAAGSATITAMSEGQSGTTSVTVNRVPVATVTVSPVAPNLYMGGTVQLTATLKDASGNPLSGRTVTWTTSTSAVATVSASGLVTGVAAGAATITAMSDGQSGTSQIGVTASAPGQVIYYSTNFNDGTTGPLDVYAYGGGSCAASTAYVDPGSARSMKCTIPAPGGAAALQAWFGTSALVGTPNDPSLDQDLFEQVRFVLAPGAAAAIGGTSCGSSNSGSQFKQHKSVYGQSGNANNGWVMSEISPCSDGNIGMFSEAEMWRNNGHANPWPDTYPSLNEGTVYDVVYRYHRYTAQGCGTIAVWVNGTKVMDLACASYMGTTGGSSAGLLFWDGATYLSGGLGPLTVYTLFAQATNYPIGAATPSP